MEKKTADMETLRAKVDRLCRERGYRKDWVARQMGWSQEHLSRVISETRPLTDEAAQKLAEVFGVPVETFLGERE